MAGQLADFPKDGGDQIVQKSEDEELKAIRMLLEANIALLERIAVILEKRQ